MTVGLTWSNAKDGEKKKPVTDEVEVSVPHKRRRFTCGCFVAVVLLVVGIAAGLAVLGYMGYWAVDELTHQHKEKSATAICNGGDYGKYDGPHGNRPSDHHDVKTFEELFSESFYSDQAPFWDMWKGMLYDDYFQIPDGVVEEWFMVGDGIWRVDVIPWLGRPTTILTDINLGYTVVKADLFDGEGVRCMVLQSENLRPLVEPIKEFVEDTQHDILDIEEVITEFWAIGEPVLETHRVGEAIRDLCKNVANFNFLMSEEQIFRAEVKALMEEHGVTYDDMYYWVDGVLEAFMNDDGVALDQLLGSFEEIVGFLPDGSYNGKSGPNGIGWSLNVRTVEYPYRFPDYDDMTYFEFKFYD
jgi:hypothetical protein